MDNNVSMTYPSASCKMISTIANQESGLSKIDFNKMFSEHEQEDCGAEYLWADIKRKAVDVWLTVPSGTKSPTAADVGGIYVTDYCGVILLDKTHLQDINGYMGIDICLDVNSMVSSIAHKTYETKIQGFFNGKASGMDNIVERQYHPLQAIESSFYYLLGEYKKVLPSNVNQHQLGVLLRSCVGHGQMQFKTNNSMTTYKLASIKPLDD